MSILNKIDLSSEDAEKAVNTWKDVYDYRRDTAFALKSGDEIINEFKVLKTFIAPDLVIITIDKLKKSFIQLFKIKLLL